MEADKVDLRGPGRNHFPGCEEGTFSLDGGDSAAATGDWWPFCRIQKRSAFVAFCFEGEEASRSGWTSVGFETNCDPLHKGPLADPGSMGERLRPWVIIYTIPM